MNGARLLQLTISLCVCLGSTAVGSRELPQWRLLEFEQKAFWVTANASIRLHSAPGEDDLWHLESRSSVASNSEQVSLDFVADSGRSLRRNRLSTGKNRRYKEYVYGDNQFSRLRRNPDRNSADDPTQWPVTNRRELAFPELPAGAVIVDPYLLLLLASDVLQADCESLEFYVHTDLNFYVVTASNGGQQQLKTSIAIPAGAAPLTASIDVQLVELRVRTLGKASEEFDFSLFGLSGDITIYYANDTLLPLQITGTAPRIGATSILLKSAELRGDAT